MAVDPYGLCPCGSGKKLKFCCSDLGGDIEKIHRMIEGDQKRAALRHTEQSLAKHPGRASLLDLKAMLELTLGEREMARETIAEFLRVEPDNPSALACQVMLLVESDGGRAAVQPLQRALEGMEQHVPQRVIEAIGFAAQALVLEGCISAALALIWLEIAMVPPDDTRAMRMLVNLCHKSGLPLMLRDRLSFCSWPQEAPWLEEARRAENLSIEGKWQQAADILDRLGSQYGAEPSLVYNRAVLAGYLADNATLAAGFHAYAEMDVPLNDAVEAEAIAQLIDPEALPQQFDSVTRVHPIEDWDALVDRLSGDRRVQSFSVDPATFAEGNQPVPQSAFLLLDKPLPESGVGLSLEDLPQMVGMVALYGRQTDRRERLELTTDKGPAFASTLSNLTEIAGDAIGPLAEEQIIGRVSLTELTLHLRWQFPPDTPAELRRKLALAGQHAAIVDRWADLPHHGLDGLSPHLAADDPQARIPLMAVVLLLEQGLHTPGKETMIAVLRDKLGLPQPEAIDPADVDMATLPMVRVPRLKVGQLSDDDLVQLYRHSVLVAAGDATAKLAREAIGRPSVADRISASDAYRRLIASENDVDRALALIDKARAHFESIGESTAQWELAELELLIDSGNAEGAQATLARIEQHHLDDPQVAAAVYRLLYETGLLPPEELGQPRPPAPAAPALASSGAADAAPGRIWTPESDRPTDGGKSALWTPS